MIIVSYLHYYQLNKKIDFEEAINTVYEIKSMLINLQILIT